MIRMSRHWWCLIIWLAASLVMRNDAGAQQEARFSVEKRGGSLFTIIAPQHFRWRSGLGLPLTYRFVVAPTAPGLTVRKRASSRSGWENIPSGVDGGTYQDQEVARYDRSAGQVFVSAGFGGGDSLCLEIVGDGGTPVEAVFAGITRYYDNRIAAVTITADDWLEEYAGMFPALLDCFHTFELPVTVGITTGDLSNASWSMIQKYVDRGWIEVASHSRTHPLVPYADPTGEVAGSRNDILAHVRLPNRVSVVNTGSLPVWLAPSGDYDDTIDSLLSAAGYLVPRLYLNLPQTSRRMFTYGDGFFAAWDPARSHFAPFYPTVELGAPEWGGGDTSASSLNGLFDATMTCGGVYHLMWHPQVIDGDQERAYLRDHLAHISRRPDIWYVGLGPLYLYHLLQEANSGPASVVRCTDVDHLPTPMVVLPAQEGGPAGVATVRIEVPKRTWVNLSLYDTASASLGTFINTTLAKGVYEVHGEVRNPAGKPWIAVFTAGDTCVVMQGSH